MRTNNKNKWLPPCVHSEGAPQRSSFCPDTLWSLALQSLEFIHKDLFVPRVDKPTKLVGQRGFPYQLPSFTRSRTHLTLGLEDSFPLGNCLSRAYFLKSSASTLPGHRARWVPVSEAPFWTWYEVFPAGSSVPVIIRGSGRQAGGGHDSKSICLLCLNPKLGPIGAS